MHLSSSIVKTKTTPTVANYLAFEFAKNYASQTRSHVSGTAYANGWYLPALSELFDIWKVKNTVDAKSNLCGGSQFQDGDYWSSSQCASSDNCAYQLDFYDGDWTYDDKQYFKFFCCIRVFN